MTSKKDTHIQRYELFSINLKNVNVKCLINVNLNVNVNEAYSSLKSIQK